MCLAIYSSRSKFSPLAALRNRRFLHPAEREEIDVFISQEYAIPRISNDFPMGAAMILPRISAKKIRAMGNVTRKGEKRKRKVCAGLTAATRAHALIGWKGLRAQICMDICARFARFL